jgi:anhydro-N-acetylmuramic acid kinase
MGKLVNAVGAMSGTSLDGIDVALIATDGEDVVERRAFASVPYDEAFRDRLRRALVEAAGLEERTARPGMLADVERELTDRHAYAIRGFLKEIGLDPGDVDLAAFHGQTVLHAPERRLTVQIGDGPRLARALGLRVVYDLRAADAAAGGQGAPLAPVYHRALVRGIGGEAMAVLNIGGVANVTFIGADGELLAFDTGPGNALLDDWMLRTTGTAIDRGGACAASGRVDDAALATLMDHAYFSAPPPKSLDRNAFDVSALAGLLPADGAATLVAFTAEAVARAAVLAPEPPRRWMVTGGGRHNRAMMAALAARLGGTVGTAEMAGFDGDAVEAEAWAYLGVRCLQGLAITFPGTTGVGEALTGGVVVTP